MAEVDLPPDAAAGPGDGPTRSLVSVVEALFGAQGPDAAAEAAAWISDDVVMVEGGRNLRSGEHRGRAGQGALLRTVAAETDEWAADMLWVRGAEGDPHQVFSLAHAYGRRRGRTIDTHVLTLLRSDDAGRVVEIRDLPYDWSAWEDFWR